jgi:hypothetical protein
MKQAHQKYTIFRCAAGIKMAHSNDMIQKPTIIPESNL